MKHLIEDLPRAIYYEHDLYQPAVYITAWNRLCVGYKKTFRTKNEHGILFSVVVEPENKPLDIEETKGCLINEYIGNAQNFDNAVSMVKKFVEKHTNLNFNFEF